jgi:type I restriction enzyme S subunit
LTDPWRQVTLGDLVDEGVAEIRTGPFGTQLRASDYSDHGVPVLNVRNLGFGTLRQADIERVGSEVQARLSGHLLKEEDIVFGRKGAVDRHVLVSARQAGWMQGSDCIRLRILPNSPVCATFLSKALLTDSHKTWMEAQCSHGATMASLNQAIVGRISLAVPGRALQRRIAAVLSAFDELIEINERRIELLEDFARSLYREWFVRFRFPGHEEVELVDSELAPIPEGWEVRPLGQVCSLLRSGGTPRRSVGANWDGGATPWFKTGELTDGPLFDSLEHVTGASGARVFDPPAIFMAIYGAPTVGRLGWVTQPSSCNQAAIAMRANNPEREQDWLWYELEAMRGHFNAMAQGAAQQNISKEKVEGTRVLVPAAVPLESFVAAVRPLRDLWEKLAAQVAKFAATRDLLLPRLVTGRLDISDVDLGVLTPTGAE